MATFIEISRETAEDSEEQIEVKPNKFKSLLSSPTCKGFVLLVLIAVAVPLPLYFLFFEVLLPEETLRGTCSVNVNYRVPCGKVNIVETECLNIDCCYDVDRRECFHYYRSTYKYTPVGSSYIPAKEYTDLNSKSVSELQLSLKEIGDCLDISLHTRNDDSGIECNKFKCDVDKERLAFEISHGEGTKIFSTHFGPLMASDNYWSMTFFLESNVLYGLNELFLGSNNTIAKVIYNNDNDHSTIPVLMSYKDGLFYSVSIGEENKGLDGPLEIRISPDKLVVMRSVTKKGINLRLCTGKTPKELRKKNVNVLKLDLPPDWVFGPHLCR